MMIFPARNLHLEGIFHGYVSHNQMVSIMKERTSHGATAGPLAATRLNTYWYHLSDKVPRLLFENKVDIPRITSRYGG